MEFFGEVAAWFSDPANLFGSDGLQGRIGEHLILSVIPLLLAVAIALPLGAWIGHSGRFANLVINIANIGRAIPSLAILALATMLLQAFIVSIGLRQFASEIATMIALTALAIPPILTNAYVGVQNVDRETVEAARGMGMSGRQVLAKLEVPLAAPLIVAGLRTSAVAVVATATLGAVAAGPGLGRFIIDGFVTRNLAKAAGGAVLVAVLAILTELAFGLLERSLTPRTSSQGRRRTPRAGGIATPETA